MFWDPRSLCAVAGSRALSARRGSVSLYLLLLLPVMCLAVALVLYSTQLNHARTELQQTADAAALAAAQTLVDDRLLTANPSLIQQLIDEAAEEARQFAAHNAVQGESLALTPNPANHAEGDIVFGVLSSPHDRDMVVADFTGASDDWLGWLNCVRVAARRTAARGNPALLNDGPLLSRTPTDAEVFATALLDRDVIGFRQADSRPIPLAPLALLSDPSGATETAWEFQVERRGGSDAWRYNRKRRVCEPAEQGDGIWEMHVALRCGNRNGPDAGASSTKPGNACLLQIGVGDMRGLCRQLRTGVVREQLADFGHKFVLGPDNSLLVPGSMQGPSAGSAEHALLHKTLEELQLLGEAKVWPLFSRIDEATGSPVVTGFVAARVAEVAEDLDGNLGFVLQPCVLALPGVLTDAAQRGVGDVALVNRYICKVRLVE